MGNEPNLHVLAEKVENLHEDINDMREEDKQWRNELRQIFTELATNRTIIDSMSQRIKSMEIHDLKRDKQLEILNAWRWKSTGILGVIVILLEVWFKVFAS